MSLATNRAWHIIVFPPELLPDIVFYVSLVLRASIASTQGFAHRPMAKSMLPSGYYRANLANGCPLSRPSFPTPAGDDGGLNRYSPRRGHRVERTYQLDNWTLGTAREPC